jgi:hypothetical protein
MSCSVVMSLKDCPCGLREGCWSLVARSFLVYLKIVAGFHACEDEVAGLAEEVSLPLFLLRTQILAKREGAGKYL